MVCSQHKEWSIPSRASSCLTEARHPYMLTFIWSDPYFCLLLVFKALIHKRRKPLYIRATRTNSRQYPSLPGPIDATLYNLYVTLIFLRVGEILYRVELPMMEEITLIYLEDECKCWA